MHGQVGEQRQRKCTEGAAALVITSKHILEIVQTHSHAAPRNEFKAA